MNKLELQKLDAAVSELLEEVARWGWNDAAVNHLSFLMEDPDVYKVLDHLMAPMVGLTVTERVESRVPLAMLFTDWVRASDKG